MLSLERLETLLAAFHGLNIGLVGDLFLDRYLDIDPDLHELSVETGLEAYQVTRIRNSPGALGTVMNNLVALSVGRLVPVSVIGDDGQAFDLLQELERLGGVEERGVQEQDGSRSVGSRRSLKIDVRHILRDADRKTPTYTKPMQRGADGAWRELNRLDLRNRAPLAAKIENELVERLAATWDATDGLIVLDQINEEGWGVINARVRGELAKLASARPEKLIFVDSRTSIGRFDFGLLKPNRSECLAAAGRARSGSPEEIRSAAQTLAAKTSRPVFCTQAERGILIAQPDGTTLEAPAFPVPGPIDPVGAGDSATAGMVAALLAGATPLEAATIGNLVASITVQQLGTTGVARPQQVLDRFRESLSIG